ncbi:hypothetical protein ABD91_26030 [Lysinibacillus sphaericus]|uniref:hypothetical protein n=1 Tax=Lysinibacillus sphaericus TaxID=1421 RepID=UPI0018CC9C4B|nr:hypothetical protein [Lysinibacillus sphaericus]MBG9694192.1 hypothetical protein [Lysinibacillus sphaericus]
MGNPNQSYVNNDEIRDLSDYSLDSIKKTIAKIFSTSHPLTSIIVNAQFSILDELNVGDKIKAPLINRNRDKNKEVKLIEGERNLKVERFEIEIDISDIKKYQWLRSVNQELSNLIKMRIRDKSFEIILSNLKEQFSTTPTAVVLREELIVERALMTSSYIFESMHNQKFLLIDRDQIPTLVCTDGFISQAEVSKADPLSKRVAGMIGGVYVVPVENMDRQGKSYINYMIEYGSILLGFGHNVEVNENEDRTKLTIGVNCTCQIIDETRIDALVLRAA